MEKEYIKKNCLADWQSSCAKYFYLSLFIVCLSSSISFSFTFTQHSAFKWSGTEPKQPEQCLNIEQLPYTRMNRVKARSRAHLLDELEYLSGRAIWRSYTHSHFNQAIMFDRIKTWNTITAQNPQRKSGLMVIGDSLSASRHFIRCLYEHPSKEITKWSKLVDSWKKRGRFSVFQRESFAAQHGATTWELLKSLQFRTKQGYGQARQAIQPSSFQPTSPLLQEIYHNSARYASLLMGTNDLLYHRGLERFSWRYIQIIETLKDHGIMPLVQTLPPQSSKDVSLNQNIKVFNRLIEVIAHVEQVPLLDLFTPLSRLNHKGLRADGIHLNAFSGGCQFSKKGLRFGQNLRNKLVFESLYNLDQNQRFRVEQTQAIERSPIIMSRIGQGDQVLSHQSDCVKQIHKTSRKQRRWKLMRRGYQETKANYQGVPVEGYGTWLTKVQSFEVQAKRSKNNTLLTLLSPGAKLDRSREQAWLKLADGSCIELKSIATRLDLPKGKHRFIHAFRKGPLTISAQDTAPRHTVHGKAIFAW